MFLSNFREKNHYLKHYVVKLPKLAKLALALLLFSRHGIVKAVSAPADCFALGPLDGRERKETLITASLKLRVIMLVTTLLPHRLGKLKPSRVSHHLRGLALM